MSLMDFSSFWLLNALVFYICILQKLVLFLDIVCVCDRAPLIL